MKIYRVKIIADKWPSEFSVQASSWRSAIGRAIEEWQKKFKGSRATELKIHAFKSGDLLKEEAH